MRKMEDLISINCVKLLITALFYTCEYKHNCLMFNCVFVRSRDDEYCSLAQAWNENILLYKRKYVLLNHSH